MKTIKQEILEGQFESNEGQKQSDHAKRKSNDSLGIDVLDVSFSISHMLAHFLKSIATIKAIIAEAKLPINIKRLGLRLLVANVTTTAVPIQPADKFVKRSERVCKKIIPSDFSIKANLTIVQMSVNQIQLHMEGSVG